MMTFKDLKKLVELPSYKEQRVPTVKALEVSGVPVVTEKVLENHGSINVYQNGYVIYRAHKRVTVFSLRDCVHYKYDAAEGAGHHIEEAEFDDYEWHIRLVLEGEDRIFMNYEIIQGKWMPSREDREYKEEILEGVDEAVSTLERMISEERVEELLSTLTDLQRKVVHIHLFHGLSFTEAAKHLGMTRQNLTGIYNAAIYKIQDIENRKINCIIVKDLSRFGRNYIETGRYLERIFPFMGVRFIAINDHYDSAEENDDKGRILIPFNNLINDTYCRDISMRVRSHLDVKRKEGQFIGSFAGYGYQKDPKDKNHLIIDEYAAGIVQEIFKQKLNGMSSQRIASHLNELGVLPPNEYKRANGFNYTCGFQAGLNQKWTVVSVNRILKNESYTGTLIQGKRRKINYKVKKSHDVGSENWIRVEDAHDAIISKGEFQQVQQLLELDTRTAPSQTTVYPLSGFLRCADCGQNMIRRTVTKNGKKYQYYHCSTYKNGGGCTPHMINSEKLTESVLAAIRHQVTLLVEAEKVLSNAELASGEQIGIKILDSQITALEAELERYSNLKIRLYQDLCDDVVSREEYGEMNTRFAQKIKEAQDKIQEIREKKQEALKHDTLLPTWLEEFKQYEHIKTLERRVVVELIDHIDVHSKTEIEIHFCFEDELHSITEKFMEYQAHHGNEVAEE